MRFCGALRTRTRRRANCTLETTYHRTPNHKRVFWRKATVTVPGQEPFVLDRTGVDDIDGCVMPRVRIAADDNATVFDEYIVAVHDIYYDEAAGRPGRVARIDARLRLHVHAQHALLRDCPLPRSALEKLSFDVNRELVECVVLQHPTSVELVRGFGARRLGRRCERGLLPLARFGRGSNSEGAVAGDGGGGTRLQVHVMRVSVLNVARLAEGRPNRGRHPRTRPVIPDSEWYSPLNRRLANPPRAPPASSYLRTERPRLCAESSQPSDQSCAVTSSISRSSPHNASSGAYSWPQISGEL